MLRTLAGIACLVGALSTPSTRADAQTARPADVASPEAIVKATYDAIARMPGADYDWPRFRSLFLAGARLIPNVEQTDGDFRVLSVDEFVTWVGGAIPADRASDRGFTEVEIANKVERFGVIAHVFSTYQKHFWGDKQVLGTGINTFQVVRHAGRWWIVGIAWDEEKPGQPIPARYLP